MEATLEVARILPEASGIVLFTGAGAPKTSHGGKAFGMYLKENVNKAITIFKRACIFVFVRYNISTRQ